MAETAFKGRNSLLGGIRQSSNEMGVAPGLRVLDIPSSLSVWLLAGSLAFASLTSLRVPGLSHISYCDLLFVLAVIAGITERLIARDFLYRRLVGVVSATYVLCMLSWFASYLVNHTAAVHILWSLKHGLGYNMNFFVLVLNTAIVPLALLSVRFRSLEDIRFVIAAWIAGVLYQAMFVVAYCNGWISHYDWYWIHFGRATGFTEQPNNLGMDMVIALPAILLFWMKQSNMVSKALLFMSIVIIFKAADYSGSRTAIGGFVVALVVFTIMHSRNRLLGACIGAGILFFAEVSRVALSAFPSLFDRTSALGRLILGAGNANGIRDTLNSTAYHQWIANPVFGVGYDMLRVAHNVYLQMLDATGLVGFIGYIVALGMPLYLLLNDRDDKFRKNETAALISAVVSIMAIGWVQPSLTDYSTSVWYGLALCLALNSNLICTVNRRGFA